MKKIIFILAVLCGTACQADAPETKWEAKEPPRVSLSGLLPEAGDPKELTNASDIDDTGGQIFTSSTGKFFRPISVKHRRMQHVRSDLGYSDTDPILEGDVSRINFVTDHNTAILAYLEGFTPDTSFLSYKSKTNKYGSDITAPRHMATGRFYTKKIGNRWWIIDPEGFQYYLRGVTSYSDGQPKTHPAAFASRFGSVDNWMRVSARTFRELGVNAVASFLGGNTTNIREYNQTDDYLPIVYAQSFGFLSAIRRDNEDLFGDFAEYQRRPSDTDNTFSERKGRIALAITFLPEFAEGAKLSIANAIRDYVGDKNLLGVYSDNELGFSTMNYDIVADIIAYAQPNHPAHLAAKEFLLARGFTEAHLANVEAFPGKFRSGKIDDFKFDHERINSEFVGIVGEKYFKACRDGIKAADPQMLYLGSRMNGRSLGMEHLIKAAAKYCDLVSINYYNNWSPSFIPAWASWADAPFFISEYWAANLYHNSPTAKIIPSGTGFLTQTEFDKGAFFQHYALHCLSSPNMVGWTWFRYQNNAETNEGEATWNGLSRINGLVDENFQVYPVFGQMMSDINQNAYNLIRFFDNAK